MLRVGTRPSPLAIKQTDELKKLFPLVNFEVVIISTLGDKNKITPLPSVEGSDFFTREIDQALFEREIDIALHSSKDLPDKLNDGLRVVLETKSISPFDVLVSKGKLKLKDLPYASRVGTSSRRRKNQIRALRQDLMIVDVRGNIGERLALIDAGKIDALVVAHAAIIRLGLEHMISEVFNGDDFIAHPKQGSLTLVTREDKWQEVKSILSAQAPVIGN
jgi:hydroxymethylbilane synthase